MLLLWRRVSRRVSALKPQSGITRPVERDADLKANVTLDPSPLPEALATAVPIAVALLSLIILAWAWYWNLRIPDPGLPSLGSFSIDSLYGGRPTSSQFHLGDRILEVDGRPIQEAGSFLTRHMAGDHLTFTLEDQTGQIRDETVLLIPPYSVDTLVDRFSLLIIASVFWLAGVIFVAVTGRAWISGRTGLLLGGFMHLIVAFLASSSTTLFIAEPANIIAYGSGLWLGLVTIQLHAVFPIPLTPPPPRWVWSIAHLVATIASMALLVVSLADPTWLAANKTPIAIGNVAWLAVSLIGMFALLVSGPLRHRSTEQDFQRNIIVLSGVVGFAPLALLTLIPQALGFLDLAVTPMLTAIPMVIVPVGYVYAALRYRLVQYDGRISRAIGFLLALGTLALLLGASVLALGFICLNVLGWEVTEFAFIGVQLAATAAVAASFERVHARIQAGIDRLFERPYAEFRAALRGVEQTLASSADSDAWAQSLCEQFSEALDVQPVALLYSQDNAFHSAEYDPGGVLTALPIELASDSPLVTELATWLQAGSSKQLCASLSRSAVPETDYRWLSCSHLSYWWPIHSHGILQAVLVFGPKGTAFAPDDIELISLASRQIGTSIENAQFARELGQLSRASLQARDDERHRVSRELHDHIIQPLIGLNFALGSLRDNPAAVEARNQVKDLITHVRAISADLRPPALDEVGLPAAARGLSRTVARGSGLVIDFAVVPGDELEVPEPLASTLYSALREALSNITKHAQASRVSVLLEGHPDGLTLVVHDDGVGFTPPSRLGMLAPSGHFGLLGMQERMAALGGTLSLHTQPGNGTRLEFHAPMPTNGGTP